jgi:hypothetical protein
MADDKRPFRANESYGRPAAARAAGNDPLAELARLIGQTDPFSEFGRDGRRAAAASQAPSPAPPLRSNAPPQNFGAQQFHPPAPQQFGAQQFAAGSDLYRTGLEDPALDDQQPPPYDATAYYQDSAASAAHGNEIYDDEEPSARRRISVIAIAGIFALAVIGTAGAFGYRALFGSSGSSPPPVIKADTTPSKIVSSSNEPQSNKLITDRVGDRSQTEKLVSREEQPIDVKPPQAVFPGMPNASAPSPAANNAGAVSEPKKVRTIAIKPDQLTGAPEAAPPPARPAAVTPPAKPAPAPRVTAAEPDEAKPGPSPIRQIPIRQAAAPANAPLSLNPDAEPAAVPARPASPPVRAAAPARVAPQAVVSADAGGSYLVQVSSQRSEVDAQSSFRALQGKFPAQLGSRQPVIRRADLGDKGTYYRAMVGPFANAGAANELCSSLKSAGGQCIVQKK